jgi:hypothetical protein
MKSSILVMVLGVSVTLAITLGGQEPGPGVNGQPPAEKGAAPVKAQIGQSHRDLDWQAPKRWVHIDTVDPKKAMIFENARKGWLATLRKDNQVLGDGRPLFWQARGGAVYTYFTFYPFKRWADMDTRGDMIEQTQKVVGEEAVKTYDLGDAALVPPHNSQIWRRVPSFDIAGPGGVPLTEVTAGVGRMEFHEVGFEDWDEFERSWKAVQEALVAQKYPLACRVFSNVYGNNQGEYILLWLAADAAQYRGVPTLKEALQQALGIPKSAALLASLDKVFPLRKSMELEKRLDLSNLGK